MTSARNRLGHRPVGGPALSERRMARVEGPVRRSPGEGGFTLIELLLVVVIIGVLAALIVPRLAGRSQEARVAAAKEEMARLTTCLDMYETDTGRYPSSDEGLEALIEPPAGLPDPEKWKGPYIKKMPVDPWSNPYQYVYPGELGERTFDLLSYGPDGAEGTEDDITD